MTRPEFYEVRLVSKPDPVRMCRHCVAVMVLEGGVAGDPSKAAVKADDVYGLVPAWWVGECVIHEDIRRFEEKRALLASPPQRIGEAL